MSEEGNVPFLRINIPGNWRELAAEARINPPVVAEDRTFTLMDYRNNFLCRDGSDVISMWQADNEMLRDLPPPRRVAWHIRCAWAARYGIADAFRWVAWKIDGQRMEDWQ